MTGVTPKGLVLGKEVWSVYRLHVGQQADNMAQGPESLLEVHSHRAQVTLAL